MSIKGDGDCIGAWIAGLLVGFVLGVGCIMGTDWREERAESQAVYGIEPDYSKPWDPAACESLAVSAAIGQIVKKARGRKSLFMEQISAVNPDAERLGRTEINRVAKEALREVADAWDRGDDGQSFLKACLRRGVRRPS